MEIQENNIDGLPVEMGLLRDMAVWDWRFLNTPGQDGLLDFQEVRKHL